VIEPVDPKIRKAIEKDLKEDVSASPKLETLTPEILTEMIKDEMAKKKKKLPKAVEKALAANDKLQKMVRSAPTTLMESPVKKAKTNTTKPKVKKQATNGAAAYWTKAEADAKAGKLPALPPFSSYKDHAEKFLKLAKDKDLAGIKKYSAEHKNETGTRENLFHYRDLLVKALRS
jgi:hypothetical protein